MLMIRRLYHNIMSFVFCDNMLLVKSYKVLSVSSVQFALTINFCWTLCLMVLPDT